MARTGRKTMPAAEQPADTTDFEALAEAGKAATALVVMEEEAATRVRAVAVQLGYDLPADSIDPDLIQRDIAANMRRSVEACLEVGRGLCVLKAACEHGGFMQRLDGLGIEDRVARRFMQSALKFTKRATSPVS